ncbi:uncharacterized protein B0H18DRAFT_1116951 [Fomitopsis serialis]|uniref:uncharacterized protein n=1 Tax=Fomitopsis serialis TaxID=139415 RepID=UPI0020074530|nr:uncharacterized protein B0H18DRAFT_1116951 [Neoantrodia serialis]KAH9930255.1 hypothetical protein B0H18DRAFT_1116951 [Neoantrodia serialis]
MQSLATFLKIRADASTKDPYRIAGNAAVEEDAADIPMDHDTAVTYVLSFCIIAAAVCGIFVATLVVKHRKRRRAQRCEKADSAAHWEKLDTRTTGLLGARDRFKRMGIFHPSTACLRQLDYRLPCRCPLCVTAEEMAEASDLNSRTATPPTGPVTSPTAPTDSSSGRTHTFPRRPRNNENAFAGLIRTRPAQPVSPHEHEWTLFHGSSPALAGSTSTRSGPQLTPIEPARLSQMSPLSSLRSSLVRELERPPLFSDDSGLSTLKVVTTPKITEDTRDVSMSLETIAAFKLVPEINLTDKNAWISDTDWVLATESLAQSPLRMAVRTPLCLRCEDGGSATAGEG